MKLTTTAQAERERIVRYLRREARKMKIAMVIPDQIIRDTINAVATEIEQGNHEPRSSTAKNMKGREE